jgi:prepilin-type N-terminal cleavage/methylation domain-containing protein/prepilin-type processing-associated H-X9-DG protein
MRKPKGFTLIELLVVISIIALLLAILMPALSKAKALAQRIVCGNHLRNLAVANSTYAAQWDGYYVPIFYVAADTGLSGGDAQLAASGSVSASATSKNPTYWLTNTAFRKLLALDEAARGKKESMPGYTPGPFDTPDSYLCPADRISRDPHNAVGTVLTSYAYNATEWNIFASGSLNTGIHFAGHKADKVKQPSEKLMFTDSVDWWCWWGAADYRIGWDKIGQANINQYKKLSPRVDGPVLYRHSEGADIAFYDGHVEYRKKQDIFVITDWNAKPKRPGMWVSDLVLCHKNYPSWW